jgi:ubiquitin C-terminal hydrolase
MMDDDDGIGFGMLAGDLFDDEYTGVSNIPVDVYYNDNPILSKPVFELEPRSESGFVGLANQGSTCYLNSLLQALFLTHKFRNRLYALTDDELGVQYLETPQQEIAKKQLQEKFDTMPPPCSIEQIVQIGFTRSQAIVALQKHNNNVEQAIDTCLTGVFDDQDIDEASKLDQQFLAESTNLSDDANDDDANDANDANDDDASNNNNNTNTKKAWKVPIFLRRLFSYLQLAHQQAASTKQLTDAFGWRDGQVAIQHDIHELYSILMDALDRSLQTTHDPKLVSEVFFGSVIGRTYCSSCGNITVRDQPVHAFSVPVKGHDTLQSSFSEFVSPSTTDGYNCSNCNTRGQAVRGEAISHLPPVMAIALNRFVWNLRTGDREKLTTSLAFPLVLDMAPYCKDNVPFPDADRDPHFVATSTSTSTSTATVMKPDINNSEHVYDLFSVVLHSGGAHGGHYHAYMRDFAAVPVGVGDAKSDDSSDAKSDEKHSTTTGTTTSALWYDFNDASVTAISIDDIAKQYGGKSESAYFLMYRRRTEENHPTDVMPPPPLLQEVEAHNKQLMLDRKEYDFASNQIQVAVYSELRFQAAGDSKLMDLVLLDNPEPTDDQRTSHVVPMIIDRRITGTDLVELVLEKHADKFPSGLSLDSCHLNELDALHAPQIENVMAVAMNASLHEQGISNNSQVILWNGNTVQGSEWKPKDRVSSSDDDSAARRTLNYNVEVHILGSCIESCIDSTNVQVASTCTFVGSGGTTWPEFIDYVSKTAAGQHYNDVVKSETGLIVCALYGSNVRRITEVQPDADMNTVTLRDLRLSAGHVSIEIRPQTSEPVHDDNVLGLQLFEELKHIRTMMFRIVPCASSSAVQHYADQLKEAAASGKPTQQLLCAPPVDDAKSAGVRVVSMQVDVRHTPEQIKSMLLEKADFGDTNPAHLRLRRMIGIDRLGALIMDEKSTLIDLDLADADITICVECLPLPPHPLVELMVSITTGKDMDQAGTNDSDSDDDDDDDTQVAPQQTVFDHKLIVLDKRLQIKQMKQLLLLDASLDPPSKYLVYRTKREEKSSVLRNEYLTLNKVHLTSGTHVLIERGELPKEGMVNLSFYLLPHSNANAPGSATTAAEQVAQWNAIDSIENRLAQQEKELERLAHTTVHPVQVLKEPLEFSNECTLDDLKQALLGQDAPALSNVSDGSVLLMRQLHKSGGGLGSTMCDDKATLRQLQVTKDMAIALQILDQPLPANMSKFTMTLSTLTATNRYPGLSLEELSALQVEEQRRLTEIAIEKRKNELREEYAVMRREQGASASGQAAEPQLKIMVGDEQVGDTPNSPAPTASAKPDPAMTEIDISSFDGVEKYVSMALGQEDPIFVPFQPALFGPVPPSDVQFDAKGAATIAQLKETLAQVYQHIPIEHMAVAKWSYQHRGWKFLTLQVAQELQEAKQQSSSTSTNGSDASADQSQANKPSSKQKQKKKKNRGGKRKVNLRNQPFGLRDNDIIACVDVREFNCSNEDELVAATTKIPWAAPPFVKTRRVSRRGGNNNSVGASSRGPEPMLRIEI